MLSSPFAKMNEDLLDLYAATGVLGSLSVDLFPMLHQRRMRVQMIQVSEYQAAIEGISNHHQQGVLCLDLSLFSREYRRCLREDDKSVLPTRDTDIEPIPISGVDRKLRFGQGLALEHIIEFRFFPFDDGL